MKLQLQVTISLSDCREKELQESQYDITSVRFVKPSEIICEL